MLRKILKGFLFVGMAFIVVFFGMVIFSLFTENVTVQKTSTNENEKIEVKKQTKWEFLQTENQTGNEYMLKTHVLSNTGNEYAVCLICIKDDLEIRTDDVFFAIVSFSKKFVAPTREQKFTNDYSLNAFFDGRHTLIFYDYEDPDTKELGSSTMFVQQRHISDNNSQIFVYNNKVHPAIVNSNFVVFKLRSADEPEEKTEFIRVVFDESFVKAVYKYFKPNGCYISNLRER